MCDDGEGIAELKEGGGGSLYVFSNRRSAPLIHAQRSFFPHVTLLSYLVSSKVIQKMSFRVSAAVMKALHKSCLTHSQHDVKILTHTHHMHLPARPFSIHCSSVNAQASLVAAGRLGKI